MAAKKKKKKVRGLRGIFGKIERATEERTGSISMRKKFAKKKTAKKKKKSRVKRLGR
jgi:hypothetical protein